MYFEQFYLGCLAHASYMIASEGMAAVVDPQRDVEIYLEEARKQGFQIKHIIETHLHADFVSGHRELASRTGAAIHLGAQAGATFPHVPVREGDEIRFGRCVLRFLETPGHTLESMSILVSDLERSPQPFAVLTGDTLFIGDVGRPDLSPTHTPQELAGLLYDSLYNKLLTLPGDVLVYPAHGAGSLCGRQIGQARFSTVAQEKLTNYALQARSRDEFILLLTSDLAERPSYFAREVEINRRGAASLEELPPLPALSAESVAAQQAKGAVVLDTRPAPDFGAVHVPGSLNIGLSGQYASWAARLLGLDTPLVLVAEDEDRVQESRMRLARVGIEGVIGYLDGGISGWSRAGRPLAHVPQIPVQDLYRQLGEVTVLDVRNRGEWDSGHIENARHIPLDSLSKRINELERQQLIAVHCKSGYRSSIASSLLQRGGFPSVLNVVGGFDAWKASHLPYLGSEADAVHHAAS